jgi:hypothetical protein
LIEERFKYFLDIQENPSDDWFVKNVSPDVLNKVFDNLSADNQESGAECGEAAPAPFNFKI